MMKRKDIFYNVSIGVMAAAILIVVIFKFVVNKQPVDSFSINGIENISVFDLDGTEFEMSHLISKNDEDYCLIFNLKDCHSCVFDGVAMLKKLRAEGKTCTGFVIHDNLEDVNGWTINFEFRPFFMMKTLEFFDHIKSPITPVLVKFKKQKVENYKYFTPH